MGLSHWKGSFMMGCAKKGIEVQKPGFGLIYSSENSQANSKYLNGGQDILIVPHILGTQTGLVWVFLRLIM